MCLPKFLPKRSTSSLEGCGGAKTLQRTVVLTLFSLIFSGQGDALFHYEVLLKAVTKPYTRLRLSPQLNWRLPRTPQPSRVKDPRVTSSQSFNFHESSWREQTDATYANGKSTSAQILHSQIPTKQQMLMGE